ncbi:hypothetical protein L2E82_44585 [Cichorium intybus]|uniref:Uncharacterized protein n=1 Tax=Cichorium intybus TaxID=13427 RepID=A0ACB8ZRJ3_CICIN|nr:hypothetical protein L2E82_44585 [Cichorium intybus]
MAELKNDEEEHALPPKRKPVVDNADDDCTKKQKTEIHTDNDFSDSAVAAADTEQKNTIQYEGSDEEDEEEDYEGVDDEDSDDDAEHYNGGAEIDRKGKGVMKDDKGKGKMIEESEEEDSSDDNQELGSESDGDSDLSDDPLAEVDLDNILPSRTRSRVVRPGVCISDDKFPKNTDA